MSEVVVEQHRGKWRVVSIHTTTDGRVLRTQLGTYNAKFKAEHEAAAHRRQLEGGEDESE